MEGSKDRADAVQQKLDPPRQRGGTVNPRSSDRYPQDASGEPGDTIMITQGHALRAEKARCPLRVCLEQGSVEDVTLPIAWQPLGVGTRRIWGL